MDTREGRRGEDVQGGRYTSLYTDSPFPSILFFSSVFFSSFIRILYPEIHTQIFIQTPCELMFSSLVFHCVSIFCIQNGSYLVSFVL